MDLAYDQFVLHISWVQGITIKTLSCSLSTIIGFINIFQYLASHDQTISRTTKQNCLLIHVYNHAYKAILRSHFWTISILYSVVKLNIIFSNTMY